MKVSILDKQTALVTAVVWCFICSVVYFYFYVACLFVDMAWLAISTKLKLYNTCILRIFLYGSDCWAISKTDACKIDALDQWCLHMLIGVK